MSAIKDVYDLITDLRKSTDDRKLLKLLIPIEEKLVATDKELVRIQKENLDSHKQLQTENLELQQTN